MNPESTIRRREVVSIIASNKGSASLPAEIVGLEMLPAYADIALSCAGGHTWKTLVCKVREWCEVCKILAGLRKTDPAIVCCQQSYLYGQLKFEFKCSAGHHFISDLQCSSRGCRSCEALHLARKKHNVTYALMLDTAALNAHDNTRLRFHCNKLRHNPRCPNPECAEIRRGEFSGGREFAVGCKNFLPCNQDFYATIKQLRTFPKIYLCRNDHRWDPLSEILSTVRLFETQFGRRFDDHATVPATQRVAYGKYAVGVEFTGYNAELRIAFTHGADAIAAKAKAAAQEWCAANGVLYIYIEKDIVRGRKIVVVMMQALHAAGVIQIAPEIAAMRLRTKIHQMDAEYKLLEDRCVLGDVPLPPGL